MVSKYPLLEMTLIGLWSLVKRLGMLGFAAKQIAPRLYDKKVTSTDGTTNLSLKYRGLSKQSYEIGVEAPMEEIHSVDGTVEYLHPVGENHFVKSVYIPSDKRVTLYISSQVDCRIGCKFCMTRKQDYSANLTVHQIINQTYSLPERGKLMNVVVMETGEPFDNPEKVLKILDMLTGSCGCVRNPKRVTVSTAGLRKGLRRFIEESDCYLAISSRPPVATQRVELAPVGKASSITEMVELLKNYDSSKQRRLSFEYIALKKFDDSQVYAKELLRLLHGLDCRVNLIHFHSIPGVALEGADTGTITYFRDYLTMHGLFTTICTSRGEDIFTVCGMLSTTKQEESSKN